MSKETISKRDFLSGKFAQRESKRAPEIPKIPEGEDYEIFLGLEEKLLDISPGFEYFPDGRISIEESKDGMVAYMAAKQSSYRLEGSNIRNLLPEMDEKGIAMPILSPDPDLGQNYRGIYSVLKIPGLPENQRAGFLHLEFHPNGNGEPFKGSIGVVMSYDNGKIWDEKNIIPIIKGQREYDPFSNKVSGAGEPCAIIINNRIHLYYVDWTNGHDGVQLATASLDDFMALDSWKHYPTTVVNPPSPKSRTVWAAMPNVSFNKSIEKYLMLFETNIGIYYADSKDGFNWSGSKELFPFKEEMGNKNKKNWLRYHTLYSPGEETNLTTTNKGWLLLAKSVDKKPHYLVGYPFEIT